MGDIRTFEDLDCWKKGAQLRQKISKIIRLFPEDEKYDLIAQMRRASRSITHNIAEGYGRFHFNENAQFGRISRGSAYEILDQLITSLEEGYIDNEQYEALRLLTMDCIKVLNGYINYLVKAAND